MRPPALALVLIGVSASLAGASECITVENDLDRLACYDKEAGRTPVVVALPPKGDWFARRETSELTDQPNVFLSVGSDEQIDCGWNKGARITLWVRCVENTTALIFDTDCHMTSGGYTNYGDVTYRVDDLPARTVGMEASTDNRSLGLWSGGAAIPEIKRLMAGERLIARMMPFGQSPFTATFPIAGLEEAIKPLREACGW